MTALFCSPLPWTDLLGPAGLTLPKNVAVSAILGVDFGMGVYGEIAIDCQDFRPSDG